MSKFPYIDIHTHKINSSKDVISLVNIFPDDFYNIQKNIKYSIGIHPWYINETKIKSELDIIRKSLKNENITAIGEIGLDRSKPNFELQKKIFIQQAKFAQAVNKPIIIHCVKAYSELISIIKKHKLTVPKIIHAFNSSKETAEQLIKHGCYLSFGKILFDSSSKTSEIFADIPDDKIFFETDISDIKIEGIYGKAIETKRVKLEFLKEKIYNNYMGIFQ